MSQLKKRRIVALFLAMIIAASMLFSFIYLAEHTNHECKGAECPICETIVQCQNNLKTIGTAVVVISAIIVFVTECTNTKLLYRDSISYNSLITQKVRLNN